MREMINHQNYKDTRAFLAYLLDVKQGDQKTIERVRIYLNNLIIWANETRLCDVEQIRPIFPVWLASQEIGKTTLEQNCIRVRQFYGWARIQFDEYREISENWIQTIRPGRSQSLQSQQETHVFYTIEEVRRLIETPDHGNLRLIRSKAAAAFLFLSGCRADAFVTLPINCIDLDKRTVQQLPEMGVRTKFKKAKETYLLNLTDLIGTVRRWDEIVRPILPGGATWFAKLHRSGKITSLESAKGQVQTKRTRILEDNIKALCGLAGVEYKSPHKFRHGHAVYGVKHARNMEELKAVSQNLMHSSISITDGLYGNLNNDDVQTAIAGLGDDQPISDDIQALARALALLQKNPQILAALMEKSG
jgi:integrase